MLLQNYAARGPLLLQTNTRHARPSTSHCTSVVRMTRTFRTAQQPQPALLTADPVGDLDRATGCIRLTPGKARPGRRPSARGQASSYGERWPRPADSRYRRSLYDHCHLAATQAIGIPTTRLTKSPSTDQYSRTPSQSCRRALPTVGALEKTIHHNAPAARVYRARPFLRVALHLSASRAPICFTKASPPPRSSANTRLQLQGADLHGRLATTAGLANSRQESMLRLQAPIGSCTPLFDAGITWCVVRSPRQWLGRPATQSRRGRSSWESRARRSALCRAGPCRRHSSV